MSQGDDLSILGHLEELRRRLFWVAVTIVIGTGASFCFASDIIGILKSPIDDLPLQIIDSTEGIGTYFKLSLYCGLALAIPVTLYHAVMFLRPALSTKERRYLYALLPGVVIAFVGGVAFAFFVLVPPALRFLFHFGEDVAEIQWRLSSYITMITRLLFAIGICFEIPIAIYFLAKIGLVTPQKLSRFRRWWIVVAFIIAAIVTPTFDPINQTIVALPLIVLYEVGILLARLAQRGRKEKG